MEIKATAQNGECTLPNKCYISANSLGYLLTLLNEDFPYILNFNYLAILTDVSAHKLLIC